MYTPAFLYSLIIYISYMLFYYIIKGPNPYSKNDLMTINQKAVRCRSIPRKRRNITNIRYHYTLM